MNGIIRSQAEYYGDSEKYTDDAGTSTNKWVIEDVFDFVASNTCPEEQYFEMVNDIDFNDHPTYRFGIEESIFGASDGSNQTSGSTTYFVRAPHMLLEGNGHKIRNVILKTKGFLISAYTIQNIVFENLILMNTTDNSISSVFLLGVYGAAPTINNLKIGCYLFDSKLDPLFGRGSESCTFNNCTINIKGKVYAGTFDIGQNKTGRKLNKCHINLDLKALNYNSTLGKFYYEMIDSYITGKIIQDISGHDTTERELTFPNLMQNSFIAVNVDFPNGGTLKIGHSGYSVINITGGSFIDKDLLPEITTNTTTENLYLLTTEQATDPEYLLSIGFPVVPA